MQWKKGWSFYSPERCRKFWDFWCRWWWWLHEREPFALLTVVLTEMFRAYTRAVIGINDDVVMSVGGILSSTSFASSPFAPSSTAKHLVCWSHTSHAGRKLRPFDSDSPFRRHRFKSGWAAESICGKNSRWTEFTSIGKLVYSAITAESTSWR